MRLWRKSGSPEPAVALSAAAGARNGSAQERLKGDAQETARHRLMIASAIFSLAFAAVAMRMGYVSLMRDGAEPTQRVAARGGAIQSERGDIVDRNGIVFATSVPVMSAFANPRLVLEPQDAARKIAAVLPELKYEDLKDRLEADRSFAWIKRGMSPREQDLVNRLGIPGLDFQAEERRIYPQGSVAAHIIGYASVDNSGLAGVERYFDQQLQSGETLQLSIDLRLQRMVETELARAVAKFSAIGATAVVMDVTNGEILAMASLPTFDPNKAKTITNEALFNRATLGVYEQGSTFKIFNTAMALDSGKATVTSVYDASAPIKIDRFTINDDHAQNRALTVAEVFKYSSNIASAKMALEQGPEAQRAFFNKIGFLKAEPVQLPEVASPLYPRNWMKINTMTIAFGHGISVTPLHLAAGSAAMINGGILYPPTLITGLSAASSLMQEEIFGPVLVSMTFRTPVEAVDLANNTRFGLAATVWTENINLALDVAPKLKAGVVWVNATNLFDAAAGFGGIRESGFGREGGWEGLLAYLKPKDSSKALAQARPAPEPANPEVTGLDRTAKLFIGGKQVRPDGGYSTAIWSPKGKLLGHVGLGNRKDIRNAVEAAQAAKGWARTTGHNRAQILFYIAENLSARAQEFGQRLRELIGKSGDAEVEASIQRLFSYAAWADKYDGAVKSVPIRGVAIAMNEACGVVGCLCPDEAPLLGLISVMAPAIAMGNTCVLVPSEVAPLAATDFQQVLETSDLPAGVVNIVTGSHAELARPLAGHLDVDAVWSFSSSPLSGLIENEAAGNLKRTWVNHARARDWTGPDGEGRAFLRAATAVKTIWVPYGE